MPTLSQASRILARSVSSADSFAGRPRLSQQALNSVSAAFASFRRSLCARWRSWRSPSISSRPRISAKAFHFSDLVLLMKSAKVRPRRRRVSLRDNSEILAAAPSLHVISPPKEPFVATSTTVAASSPCVTFRMACWRPSWVRSSICPVKYHSRASAIVLFPVPLSPKTAMLWPSPKSTTSSPGTPRKAFMARRCRRSLASELLDELTYRRGATFVILISAKLQ